MNRFLDTLKTQRWDDHRYYHQSRINQSLHFVSAISFLVAYVYLFIDPAVSGLIGWLISMSTRQSGHFFFEPQGFDHVNNVSNDYKEAVKVGYNLHRKVVLIAVCVAVPVLAFFHPQWITWAAPESFETSAWRLTGIVWLFLGAAGLLFRVGQIWQQKSLLEGIAWATKIITDPVHDIMLYHRAPLYLLRGELLDPMEHVKDELAGQHS
ncbi:hypothetical protein KIK84_07210 [Curvibacter sp. CHRR-16]|uniref:hypothetical protein n=1 Tax=Curvibacter sp. CHRR-16 TaxID=2835872 RepID=UPI001BDAB7CC|nr:hypothetical protein [Curvibacter sp. CHRR-16]MBT0570107.1 hypothetical protein [Curvibacter sp. CHRR-16]